MQKTTVSGTTEQIMQTLADEIGKLWERTNESVDHSIATDAVLQVLTGVLKDGGTLNVALWNSTLETMAESYSSPTIDVDEEGKRRLKRVAEGVLMHRISTKPTSPSHPSLRVIDGGKD